MAPERTTGRTSAGIQGKSPLPHAPPTPKAPPAARKAPKGPLPPPQKGVKRQPAPKKPPGPPPAPGWLSSFAMGLDVTTQFLKPKDPKHPTDTLFDWDAVVNADKVIIPGGKAAATKISFIVIKATLGSGPKAVATNFKGNWKKLQSMYRSVGLFYRKAIIGAYHFMLFGPNEDPVAQANAYLQAVGGPFFAMMPPILDVEDMRPETLRWLGFVSHEKEVTTKDGKVEKRISWQLADRKKFLASSAKCVEDIKKWIKVVRDFSSRDPIIYTFPNYWPTINSPQDFKDLPLWIADYSGLKDTGPTPKLPVGGGWSEWAYWQFAGFPQTKDQFVPGIGHGIDLNIFNGSVEQLERLIYGPLFVPHRPVIFF